ncbi:MAG TPA: alpha/beta hydrolase-fold protein, partial [Myxococcaceae bacterium]|nr:alpha/beta hydrolase-fold protein [Myxococcaceae bacterium]
TFLGNTRDVIVYLPVGYSDDTTTRYPVLYMQDGQNLMDPRTSFAGEWGVDETAQRLLRCGQMSPVIIVGVYNTGNRIPEYTQVADPNNGGGNADNYARFLLQELKPRIDATYRTRASEPAGIAGSSLGGLVSLYLGYSHPEAFNRIGAVSPSIWWSNKDITTRYTGLTSKLPLRIWEDIGTAEGTTPAEEVQNAAGFRDVLVSKGWVQGDDLFYLQVQGAGHNEAAWSKRIDQILAYLYPPAP